MKTEILITQDTRKGTTLIERFHMSLFEYLCTSCLPFASIEFETS